MNKKILTIHSEDRDINKWPNPSEFEVILPNSYTNIQQINLLNFSLTNNFYNISEKLMNNYINTGMNSHPESIFIIPDGFYTPDQLAVTLTKIFQKKSDLDKIYVLYDRVKIKFLFIIHNSISNFNLNFNDLISTDKLCLHKNFLVNPEKIAYQYDHWGIGYNLGFKKKIYVDADFKKSDDSNDIDLTYGSYYVNEFDIYLNDPLKILPDNFNLTEYKFLYSEATIDLNPLSTIYMEIDKHNYADEIMPYQYRSNYLYCNDYNSSVNSYFAKILLNNKTMNNLNEHLISTRLNGNIVDGNILYNNNIDRLIKLKFKFRYHNNILVDFDHKNFNFTIEFTQGDNIKKC